MFAYGGTLRAVHGAPVAGLVAQALILIALAATIGLGGAGWAVGAACALVLSVALARAVAHYGEERLSPAR